MTRLGKSVTFSNVIALVALFVALGGTVYAAGKISGNKIKPKSIPGNRIKPGTLTGKQIKSSSLTGKQVVGSSLTGVSASNLASVHYASSVVVLVDSLESGVTGTAACPPGTYVLGGGAIVSNDLDAGIGDSGPTAARTGWEATGFAGDVGITMTVTAICTAAASATG
jgi:hypothetical protein